MYKVGVQENSGHEMSDESKMPFDQINRVCSKPIIVYPKLSTGLWDGAFLILGMYRSDGERII